MNAIAQHPKPAIQNAMWPGLVGKGPDSEHPIDLDTMLNLTAQAEVDGVKFHGVDLFLSLPHADIDSDEDHLRRLAEKLCAHKLVAGSLVAPVWPATNGVSEMGSVQDPKQFLVQVCKACTIGKKLRELGIRKYGVIRIESAASPSDWLKDPVANQKLITDTFCEACTIAESHSECLAPEGGICWGGMHGWKRMVELLEMVCKPRTIGFQADMAHTMLYTMGYNSPESCLLPRNYDWKDKKILWEALRKVTRALRPWTIDCHVARNDGTVKGSGSHDKTGRHCPPNGPNGKLDLVKVAGLWMCDENRTPTRAFQHICWDCCMFSNAVILASDTWREVLAMLIKVRNANGWN